jgi:MurNAc alpha-1-phosphate uridylyltransferase
MPMQDSLAATALLLAAGRGERMRPLTDSTPKPLLVVRGKPLMQWPLEALARGGCKQVVVNTAWLGGQIADTFGPVFAAAAPGDETVQIRYSQEGVDFGQALETAGGIVRALPLLDDVFWVLAGDVYAPDFVFSPAALQRFLASDCLAHLWLVPNPEHNPRGDFGLAAPVGTAPALALNLAAGEIGARYTYSTMGLFRKALFAPPWCDIPSGNAQGTKAPLAPLLRAAMDHGRISAELYTGRWTDVGTPQRLAQLQAD